jgi:hypothetical protein
MSRAPTRTTCLASDPANEITPVRTSKEKPVSATTSPQHAIARA